ncbi:MAG: hypothetical protein ACXW1F_08315, partial [Halobacteriota archaeon]
MSGRIGRSGCSTNAAGRTATSIRTSRSGSAAKWARRVSSVATTSDSTTSTSAQRQGAASTGKIYDGTTLRYRAKKSDCTPSRIALTMSGASSVSRIMRLTKLRVTPSASAISAADRHLPSSQQPLPSRIPLSSRPVARGQVYQYWNRYPPVPRRAMVAAC